MNRSERVEDVLHRTLEETKNIMEQMRKSVTDELITSEYDYIVYTTICSKEKIDLLPDEMTCILRENAEKFDIDLLAVKDATDKGVAIVVDELFLKKDISSSKENDNWVTGSLISNYRVFPVRFQLRRKMEYLNLVKGLDEWFRKNGVPSQLFYIPYLYQFYYVVLEPVTIEWKENEVLEKLEIDYKGIEGYYKKDVVPVWNVKQELIHKRGTRILKEHEICFQYELECREDASGLLVEVQEETLHHIGYLKNGNVKIESDEEQDDWNVLYFNQVFTDYAWEEPLLSNQIKDTFANRYAGYFGMPVLSSAELRRKIESYQDVHCVEYVDYELAEDGLYDSDEPRDVEKLGITDKRILLLLQFRSKGEESYLARETMNYVVDVVQKEYFSYHVVGRLIDL